MDAEGMGFAYYTDNRGLARLSPYSVKDDSDGHNATTEKSADNDGSTLKPTGRVI